MILYKIRDWDKHFENNRSRTVEDLRWVAIPNRHDGENFSQIMLHPDGAIIFAGWILIVQIASKCTPRGVLIKDNQTPHTATSLSVKCRCPVSWMNVALEYMSKHTDWLAITEVADACQAPDRQVSAACQSPDEEGREGKGWKGGKGKEQTGAPLSLLIHEFEAAWDAIAENVKIPKCLVVSDKRRRTLEARFREPFFCQNWEAALGKIRSSAFCKGKNDRGWVATFDWFIQPDTVPKIMEGKYDDRKGAHQPINKRNLGLAGVGQDDYAAAAQRKVERQMAEAANRTSQQVEGNGT